MGLKIALPTADLIGVSGATTSLIDGTTSELVPNTIYVTGVAETSNLSVTIPATANDGAVILLKKLGSGNVSITDTNGDGTGTFPTVDGVVQTEDIVISNNQPVRFVFHSSSIGWIIT